MAPKILVILTSHSRLGGTNKPTKWFLPEFAHPYDEFESAGFKIIATSPASGIAPLDPMSVEIFKGDPSSVAFLNNPDWQTTHKLADYLGHADEFDAVFIPGGHGPIFDLAVAKVSQQVITEFAEKGKIVAAVCHGPAAFMNVTLAGGEHLLKRKEVTGFSNAEEDSIGLSEVVPFLLEDKLKEVGAKFVKAEEP